MSKIDKLHPAVCSWQTRHSISLFVYISCQSASRSQSVQLTQGGALKPAPEALQPNVRCALRTWRMMSAATSGQLTGPLTLQVIMSHSCIFFLWWGYFIQLCVQLLNSVSWIIMGYTLLRGQRKFQNLIDWDSCYQKEISADRVDSQSLWDPSFQGRRVICDHQLTAA